MIPMSSVLPCLPDPSNQSERQKYLRRQRLAYQYDHAFLEPLPLLNTAHQGLPFAEWLSPKYLVTRLIQTSKLPLNQTLARVRAIFDRVDELEDYQDFFPFLPKPSVMQNYYEDKSFAEQRLSGPNPVVLQRFSDELKIRFAEDLKVLQGTLQSQGSSLDLDAILNAENLYLADYTNLAFVQRGSYEDKRQYLAAPLAFFYYEHSNEHPGLRPLGIRISRTGPVITPGDRHWSWQYAKLCVQIADANHHEMSTHLCRTHFVMEPFAIATARQLAKNHPLGLLLRPHFRFLLANGELGRTRLLGYIDRLLPGTLADSLKIVTSSYKSWNFQRSAFPQAIKNRGMDDQNAFPHYPYRDDGNLLWHAIYDFVFAYLQIYYETPQVLKNDSELQAWAEELASPLGGRVQGFPHPILDIEQLVDIVTNIIFTSGPQHSAVNYTQYEYMSYMPNMPFAAYQPIRKTADIQNELSLVPVLPPRTQAAEQLAIMYILGLPYYYDKLGHYDHPFAGKAKQCVENFQEALNEAEQKIDARNQYRSIKYPYLKPSQITNSISI